MKPGGEDNADSLVRELFGYHSRAQFVQAMDDELVTIISEFIRGLRTSRAGRRTVRAIEASVPARATQARLRKHRDLVRRVLERWDSHEAKWRAEHHGREPSRHRFALKMTGYKDVYQGSKHLGPREPTKTPVKVHTGIFNCHPRTIEPILTKNRPRDWCGPLE
jgi:hypothetical protein